MVISSRIFSLGNSNAIRIPRVIMEALSFSTDEPITLEVTGQNQLVISKEKPSMEYPSIKELFAGYSGSYRPSEIESTGLLGRELI